MNLNVDDPVRISIDGMVIGYGIAKRFPSLGEINLVEVEYEDGSRGTYPRIAIDYFKEDIVVGTHVVFYKSFEKVDDLDGAVIHGGFIKEYLGETGTVTAKKRNGICKVLASDFSWEYWIPESSLFKINTPLYELKSFKSGDRLHLVKTHTGGSKKLQWSAVYDDLNGFPCEVVHFEDSIGDYPAYVVRFDNGVLLTVYEGWLSESPDNAEVGTIIDIGNVINDNGTNYIVKGKIRMFETGAVRSVNAGKPRFDLISPYAEQWLAEELAKNGGEYGTGNYMLGIPELVCIESLQRHLNAVRIGLKIGNSDLIKEAVNIYCNAMFLCHTIKLRELGLYTISEEFKRLGGTDGQAGESKTA